MSEFKKLYSESSHGKNMVETFEDNVYNKKSSNKVQDKNKPESAHDGENYKLWGGRFEIGNDKIMKMFNDSLPVDKRLWREDIIVNLY